MDVVRGTDYKPELARTPDVPGFPIDEVGGRFLVASRTRLGICVQNTTADEVADSALVGPVIAAIRRFADHPDPTVQALLEPRPLVSATCPGVAAALRPLSSGGRPPQSCVAGFAFRASPFRVHVFVVATAIADGWVGNRDGSPRRCTQEILSRPESDMGVGVSDGLYLTLAEFMEADRLERGLLTALGLVPRPRNPPPIPFGTVGPP